MLQCTHAFGTRRRCRYTAPRGNLASLKCVEQPEGRRARLRRQAGMPSGGAARRPLETRWAAAGSEVLAKRDAAPLRRAHQQAASRRALAISTHATPATPSETSSAHLAQRGRVSAQMFGVGVRRKVGRREWRTDHEDVCACLPKGRRRRRRRYRPRCHPATPVATEPVEPSIDKSAGKERGGGQLPKAVRKKTRDKTDLALSLIEKN